MAGYSAIREHEICCGHRVYGHEGKCKDLHGHNYKFELYVASYSLDNLGRVIDFSLIKDILCDWLEKKWDHKTLLWNKDPLAGLLINHIDDTSWLVRVPFNPTVENMAQYFVEDIAPGLLLDTGVDLVEVRVWETSKCSALYVRKDYDAAATRNVSHPGHAGSVSK